jgi:putative salt-induced outer membrane protein YdiY
MHFSPGFSAIKILIPVLMATGAWADTLTMKNGDRITGEIQNIWDNEVVIEPVYDDDVGITIDIDDIASIESERQFEIELGDGEKITATMLGSDSAGQQQIEVDGEARPIQLAELYELDEIDDYYDWDSHIDFNASVNKGNTDSVNTKLFADTNLKLGDHRHIANITFNREDQDGITTKDQDLLRYNYNWLYSDPWFFATSFSAERDPIKELDQRLVLGLGIGRDFINTPRTTLNAQLGGGVLTEKNTSGESNEVSVATWAFRYRHDLFNDDLGIFHDHSITSYLSGRTNTIIKTSTGARYEITDLLYANLSLDYDIETEPAGDLAETDDLSLVVGLGLEF